MKAILSLIVVFAFLLTPGAQLRAQDRSQPGLRIAEIDVSSFPDVAVYLYGENLDVDLTTLPIVLAEDNLQQNVLTSQSEEVGAQVAFAIDASRNILSGGASGRTRIDEVRDAVNEFVGLGILSAEKDWLSAYATADIPDQYRTVAPWGQDHQAVANALIQDVPAGILEVTSLFGLIDFTLTQIANSPAPSRLQRSIVIFSDGADIVSNVEVDDIVRRAEQLDVRLHTVMLGGGARDSRRNLGRLAEVTGGSFVEFTALSAMQPVWQQIAAQRVQQRLTYRLTQEQPRQLSVSASLPDGRALNHARDFPVVGARAAELTIKTANDQNRLVRLGAALDTPLAQLEPKVLPIALQAVWPDGHPRAFRSVEYSLDTDTRVQDVEPFTEFEFPIAELGEGIHTIRATATDELGLRSSAPPVTLEIVVQRPSAGQAAGGQPRNSAASSAAVSETTSAAAVVAGAAANAAASALLTATNTATNTAATDPISPTGIISAAIPIAAAAPPAEPTATTAPAAPAANSPQQPTPNQPPAAKRSINIFGQQLPSELRVGGYAIAVTMTTLAAAGVLLLLLALALILIFMPRRANDHYALSGADSGSRTFSTPPPLTAPEAPTADAFNDDDLDFMDDALTSAPTYLNQSYRDLGASDDDMATMPSMTPFDFEEEATEPVRMVNFAPAHLVYIEGGEHLPDKLALEYNHEHRIGRSAQMCNLVIDDRRVSRRHATIVGRADSFHIQDDGSAGGTYVNERRLGVSDAPILRDGDVVNFNEVAYRFVVRNPGGNDRPATEPPVG